MIRTEFFGERASMVPLMVAMLVLLVLVGCGGDKQEEPRQQAQLTPVSDQDMVPASEAQGDTSGALHPAEMEPEVKPFSPPPPGDDAVDPIEPIQQPKGTSEAEVVQKPVRPVNASIDGSKVEQVGGNYSIMVGSFLQESNATARTEKIINLGFRPVQETATIGGQEFYRVHLRGIESYDEAESLGFFLKEKLGIDYLVLKR